jgi:soluble lytic murein transglycosylase-like protein
MLRRVLLAAACLALLPSVASAQIYVWRDAAGNLVMSTERKDPSAKTYAVPNASGYRVTTPAPNTRAGQYDALIAEHARAQGLSSDFVRAVIHAESGFNAGARSVRGAMGLMQLMPKTASDYHVLNAYDPAENIRAGAAYLKSLLTRFDGDEALALAAYNAGPETVERYGRKVPPYRETRNYIARIRNSAPAAATKSNRIYETVKIVNGQPRKVYSDRPSTGAAVVPAAERR